MFIIMEWWQIVKIIIIIINDQIWAGTVLLQLVSGPSANVSDTQVDPSRLAIGSDHVVMAGK